MAEVVANPVDQNQCPAETIRNLCGLPGHLTVPKSTPGDLLPQARMSPTKVLWLHIQVTTVHCPCFPVCLRTTFEAHVLPFQPTAG